MQNQKELSLCTNLKCNNNCLFCFQGERKNSFNDAPFAKLEGVLKKNNGKYQKIGLGGGEPTLLKEDLTKLLAKARELGYSSIDLVSNGRMFSYKSFTRQFIQFKDILHICISIHGATARTHESLTRAEGSFEQTLKGIVNLVGYNLKPTFRTVITKQNFSELPEIVLLMKIKGITIGTLAFPKIEGSALVNFNEVVPRLSQAMPFVKKAIATGRKIGVFVKVKNIPNCFLKGYEGNIAYIQDYVSLHSPYLEFEGDPRELLKFVKFPFCRKCKWGVKCNGFWEEYLEKYGLGEFHAVSPC